MKTYSITVEDEDAVLLEQWLVDGRFENVNDAMMCAIQTLDMELSHDPEIDKLSNDYEQDRKYRELKAAIEHSVAQADRGELLSEEEVFDKYLAQLDAKLPVRAAS